MILDDSFNTFCRANRLSDEDRALVKRAWLQCESEIFIGRPEPCALLKRAAPACPVVKKQQKTLTDGESNWLICVLSEFLNSAQENLYKMKVYEAELWSRCDPNDLKTEPVFHALNQMKDNRRLAKLWYTKMSQIQRKLKNAR